MGRLCDVTVYDRGEVVSRHLAITDAQADDLYWQYFSDDYENEPQCKIIVDREWEGDAPHRP